MSTPQGRWLHIIWNTLGSWLPGDPRGFRNRDHRIHSSGDYKNPPPKGEHAGLHRWARSRARPTVLLPIPLRPLIARTIVDACHERGALPIALSCGANHVHLLVRVPLCQNAERDLVRACKARSSLAIRSDLPGSIWSRGRHVVPIKDRSHQLTTFRYITQRQEASSHIWRLGRPPSLGQKSSSTSRP